MKKIILSLILAFFSHKSFPQKGQFIFEGSLAQSIKGSSTGYNIGMYVKTKWPVAIRAGYTQVFTGDVFNQYLISYIQAGFMDYKEKWSYHLLLGLIPAAQPYKLPVYTAGAGYLLNERRKKDYRLVFQLNYAKNRLEEFFWGHFGIHIVFKGKQKK
jgi:hypothetical protein